MNLKWLQSRKGFFLYSVLRISVLILGLMSNILIVRKLTVNEFGIYSVALMLTSLLTTIGFSWSSSSILYFGSRERAETGTINKTFWARNIIVISSLIIATFFFILLHRQINNYVGLNVWYLILIWLYVSVLEDYLNQYFLAVKKQLVSGLISFTAKLIFILLLLTVNFDVITLITINIVSHLTVLLYVLGVSRKDISPFVFDKKWFRKVFDFSIWQLFGFSGLYLINFGDIAIIKYFMTIEDVGLYNAAYKLFMAIAGFSYVISNYYASTISTYFTSKNTTGISRFFYRERFVIFGLSAIMHIIVMLFSDPIILILYGEPYSAASNIFKVLMIGSLFRYLTIFYMLFYNTNGKHKIQQIINIFGALINLLLDIFLVKALGLIGAAIATTIAIFIMLSISYFYCEKRIRTLST